MRIEGKHEVVHVLATKLSKVLLVHDFLIVLGELDDIDAELGVPEVNEQNVLGLLFFLRELLPLVVAVV